MAEDRETPNGVGYGNPPKHSRFRPGQSGNPGGRPKGSKSFKSVLQDELDQQVNLSEQGVVSKVTNMEALAKRLVGDALSGNPRALAELLRQVNVHLPASETTESRNLPAPDEDVRLLMKNARRAVTKKWRVRLMTLPQNSDVHALLRQHFPALVEKVFQMLHPGREFTDNWHISAICHALESVAAGEERRLMINVPPRTLKSIITSVAWVAFLLGHDPARAITVVSHNHELASDLAAKFRKIVESGWYKSAFPTTSGAPQKDNERNFVTSEGGGRASVSTHGSVTGRGFDVIIIDDPLDAADAVSQTACDRVNHWYDSSLSTRLTHPAKSAIVLVKQRLSVFDLAAHVAEQEPWARLIIPATAERDISYQIGPDEFYMFEQGQLLDPERLSQDFLDTQKNRMGEATYLAQYQQTPAPAGGGEIDIGLFARYKHLPREYDARFLSIDAASGSQSGSYSVIQLYQVTDGKLLLCANYRGFWSFPTLVNHVRSAREKSAADFIVIEKASSGMALLEVLWEAYPAEVRSKLIQKWSPRHPKDVRMSKAMVTVAAGKVLLPEDAAFLDIFIPELQAFPAGINDDQVDALSQAVEFFNRYLKSAYNPHGTGGGRVIAAW